MRIEQRKWTKGSGWSLTRPAEGPDFDPQLLLLFGGTVLFDDAAACRELRAAYPGAVPVGCSTAGEIRDMNVTVEEGVATALEFERTGCRVERIVAHGNGDYRVHLAAGAPVDATAIVLACPAWFASGAVASLDPEMSDAMAAIPSWRPRAPSCSARLAFRLTCSTATPRVSARRARMGSSQPASFGASAALGFTLDDDDDDNGDIFFNNDDDDDEIGARVGVQLTWGGFEK